MHKLYLGHRVYHRRRDQDGTYEGLTEAEDTVWVRFDDVPDAEKVSRDQLSKVAE